MQNNLVKWLLARLSERSTWIGIISIISAVGLKVAPESQEAVVSLGIALVGAILALTKDPAPVVVAAVDTKADLKAQLDAAIAKGDYTAVTVISAQLAQ